MDSRFFPEVPSRDLDGLASSRHCLRDSLNDTIWSSEVPTLLNHDLEGNTFSPSLGKDASPNQSSFGSDLEKKGVEEDPRAHIFLGRPMTVAHEIAFFAVVSTANFTPRKLASAREYSVLYYAKAN